MKAYLEFVTVPTADTQGTTILLHYDSKRYTIGRVSEGTQRAWVERGISMRKLEHIFLTGKTGSENLGGILGMMLTLADAKKEAAGHTNGEDKPELNITGGSNLLQSVAAARRFIFRKGLPLKIKEAKEEPNGGKNGERQLIFADENIRVWPMVIKPEKSTRVDSPTLSSRKRTFDELNGIEPTIGPTNGRQIESSEAEREARYDALRQAVVHDMFGSDWSLDCLLEIPLREVQLPCKVWIRDEANKGLREYTGPLPGGPGPLPAPDLKVLVRKPWPGALVSALPPTTPKEDAISYIIRPWPRRGKFDTEKAKALGVPYGPVRSQLARGQNITLDSGKVITPDMVIGEPREGSGFVVVDLPTDDYVKPLVSRAEWQDKTLMENVTAVIWILGPGVSNNAELRSFIGAQTELQHVFASPDVCPNELAFESSAASAVHLAQMDIDNFPIPHFDNITVPQASFRAQNQLPPPKSSGVSSAARGFQLHIEPNFVAKKDSMPKRLDTFGLLARNDEEHVSLARSALESVSQGQEAAEIERWKASLPNPGPEVEIITLGTGSALPSKYRNVSATLVRVPGHGNYMLDCGENTLGQLQRVFKPIELREVLKDLRMIWISHLHADHHLGTVSLIKAWHSVVHGPNTTAPPLSRDITKDLNNPKLIDLICQKANTSKPPYLAVISHAHMLQYLSEYSYIEDFGYSHILPLTISPATPDEPEDKPHSTLLMCHNKSPMSTVNQKVLPKLLGIQDIQSVLVTHCRGAMAVAITFPPASDTDAPFKLAFSGDTRPSKRFAMIGFDATVLVHEATFDDELQVEAYAKKHCTTSEALRVGAEMQAKSVVLTHFSQRYQKLPILDVNNFGAGLEGVEERGEEGNEIADPEDEIRDVPEPENAAMREQQSLNSADLVAQDTKRETADAVASSSGGGVVSDGIPEKEKSILWSPLTFERRDRAAKEARAKDMKVCVAFDYMRVKVGDIPRIAALRPAMMALFAEEKKEEEKDVKGAEKVENASANGSAKQTSKRHKKKLARQKSEESLKHSDDVQVVGK